MFSFRADDMSITEAASPDEPEPIHVSNDLILSEIGFSRSVHEDINGIRQQTNGISAFIDASHIYGSDAVRAAALRTNSSGMLATHQVGGEHFLPFNTNGLHNAPDNSSEFFLAGDIRANEQVGLTALHTLFVREHNWWATRIWDQYNGHGSTTLSDEQIYQRARMMVAAEIQAITFREWLPILIGEDLATSFVAYNASVNPGIGNEFSTAAFRVGHTMVSDNMLCLDDNGNDISGCSMKLSNLFFRPDKILQYGIGGYIRGQSEQICQEVDTLFVDSLRNELFANLADPSDLLSLNIQRGRDHGLPSYNVIRQAFGLTPVADFSDFNSDVSSALATVYDNNITLVDAFVGMVAEEHNAGAVVGETLQAVLSDQFARLRDGDRFFYKNPDYLPPELIEQLDRITLADIVHRNTDVTGDITFQEGLFM